MFATRAINALVVPGVRGVFARRAIAAPFHAVQIGVLARFAHAAVCQVVVLCRLILTFSTLVAPLATPEIFASAGLPRTARSVISMIATTRVATSSDIVKAPAGLGIARIDEE
jgi:hypothetical protein